MNVVLDWRTRLAEARAFVEDLHAGGMGGILRTPCIPAPALSAETGCEVWVKLENLQPTGSFKERGAFARLSRLTAEERARGVVAASAGNHAQGVARHASAMGVEATIFMPEGTPTIKINQTRQLGAKVVLKGTDFDDANRLAQAYCEAEGRVFVHPFDDAFVLAGQGTIATEMLEAVPDLDTLVVPVGGGGLAAGMIQAARSQRPDIEIIGVQAELFPAAHDVFHNCETRSSGVTLAEGIAVREPGRLTQRVLRDGLDDMVLVSERQVERALNLFLTRLKVLPEGAGAAGLAALMSQPERYAGKKVGLVLTGGNVDTRLLSSLLLRDLARSHRLARLRIELLDVPGQLSTISSLIADAGGNVTDVSYHKTFSDLPAKVTYIDISLEAQDGDHMNAIYSAVGAAGFKVEFADY